MKKNVLTILFAFAISFSAYSQNIPCLGESRGLKTGSLMPYTKVKVGNAEGFFLIDFCTTASSIDTNGFINSKPVLANNSTNSFDNFDFFGSWGTVKLNIQNQSNIQGLGNMKQAGIIGTDFLCFNVFTLDYTDSSIFRASNGSFCDDSILIKEGFKAVSTAGYFSNDLKKLNNTYTPNIPTIPIKIGNASAIAQIDPGYDDRFYRHSININQAFFDAIRESGVVLIENTKANFILSTCANGVQENVKAYKLPPNISFTIIGTDGNPVIIDSDVNIFLKQTPAEAVTCGGIGTWKIPAAQIGASFLIDAQKVVFDPFNEKVWFYIKQ
jgi:hypothetical protein